MWSLGPVRSASPSPVTSPRGVTGCEPRIEGGEPTSPSGLRSWSRTSPRPRTRRVLARERPSSTTAPTRPTRSGRTSTPLMDAIIEGAAAAGARLVFGDNLYAYGPVDEPLTEDLPYLATGPNGRTRARIAETLVQAHEAGRIQATIGRGGRLLRPPRAPVDGGRPGLRSGDRGEASTGAGQPRHPSYRDLHRGLRQGVGHPGRAGGGHGGGVARPQRRDGHCAPVRSDRLRVGRPASSPPSCAAVGDRDGCLFSPTLRAVTEQLYQSERPWVVDSSKFERAFGWSATPLPDAISATVAWFRDQART